MSKTYVQLSKAWYGKANLDLEKKLVDEVSIQYNDSTPGLSFSWGQA